jgi:hypothetical protein
MGVLTCRRSPPEAPRPLPTSNATFPELVFYYLPQEEWMSNGLPGSHAMGERQRLLLLETPCLRDQIDKAWDDFERLLGHRHSERQRMNLIMTTMQWGLQWQLYREIQTGLYGSTEEHETFLQRWFAQGLEEAMEDTTWTNFQALDEFSEENTLERGYREPLTILYPHLTEDELLDSTLPGI